MPAPDASLAEVSRLAREMAEAVCWRDPGTGESCAWYHGLWPDLRAVGLGSSVSYHADFLAQAFARVRKSKPRVLVSGAADHAILAHVFAACDANAIDCEVTVIDRCETPLRVNVWYAARAGRSIATCRTDVFEHASTVPYDVVVAHAFLGYFQPERRRALFRHWRSMLAPSGAIVIVNRVRGGDPSEPVAFGQRDAEVFSAIAEAGLRPSLDEAALRTQLDRVAVYVLRQYAYPVPREELAGLLADVGLEVAISVSVSVTANDRRIGDIGGVALASNATYACMLGTR